MKDLVLTTFSRQELRDIILDCLSVWAKHSPEMEKFQNVIEGKELYTSNEARDLLKISRTTEHELNKKGVLTPVMVGGRKRYTKEAIEAVVVEI